MDDLMKTMRISSAGMRVQGERLRVISQNLANAEALPQEPNGNPYRRQVVTFKNQLDRTLGIKTVRTDKVRPDKSDFGKRYEPNHPGADPDGYVLTPNVNPLIEMTDMREAQRSYEANLNAIKATKAMLNLTIDVLR